MDISKDLIFASSMGIIVACFICIIVWPQFMGAELNKMLRFVVLPNMKRTLEEVRVELSITTRHDAASTNSQLSVDRLAHISPRNKAWIVPGSCSRINSNCL